jgi:hypothetical protein
MSNTRPMIRLAAVALALVAGCSGPSAKADAAITNASEAITAIGADAEKVLPYEVEQLKRTVAAARDTLAKGGYAAAEALVAEVPVRAQELAGKVAAKRVQLTAELDTLGVALKKNLDAIQARLDEFARTRRFPRGVTQARVDSVKQVLATAPEEWNAIQAQIQAGELDAAYGKGTVLRLKVSQALEAVGLVSGEAEWHNLTMPPKP